MKFKSILISGVLFTLLSCHVDRIVGVSDEVTINNVRVSNFSGIEISDDFNAYIRFSDSEERVEIEANENLHRHIIVETIGGRLIVRTRHHLNIIGRETLNVFITTKRLSDFIAEGDSKITLENVLVDDDVKIKVSGDSYFYGEIEANNVELTALGDSKIDLYGEINTLDAYLAGDSSLTDYDLTTKDLRIELSGDSNAYLTVTDYIDIDASGDSRLHYKGDAEITHQHLTGDSKIIKL